MTAIKNSVALVTGGSRGVGKALVDELFARGARKVYATARDPRTVTHPDAIPLALEVTDPAEPGRGELAETEVVPVAVPEVVGDECLRHRPQVPAAHPTSFATRSSTALLTALQARENDIIVFGYECLSAAF